MNARLERLPILVLRAAQSLQLPLRDVRHLEAHRCAGDQRRRTGAAPGGYRAPRRGMGGVHGRGAADALGPVSPLGDAARARHTHHHPEHRPAAGTQCRANRGRRGRSHRVAGWPRGDSRRDPPRARRVRQSGRTGSRRASPLAGISDRRALHRAGAQRRAPARHGAGGARDGAAVALVPGGRLEFDRVQPCGGMAGGEASPPWRPNSRNWSARWKR